jgi:hypothetical protein
MKQQERKPTLARREFLRSVGIGATVAAASAGSIAGKAVADSENNDEKRKARYRETEHVKAYYSVNRYPS